MGRTSYIRCDDDDDDDNRFVLDQHTQLDIENASSLDQQFAGRHVAPIGHIILIPSQLVFDVSPWCYVRRGEAANTNCIVFGLTHQALKPTIYRSRHEYTNYYTTDIKRATNYLCSESYHDNNLFYVIVYFFQMIINIYRPIY